MNREIKFRAWNKERKMMAYGVENEYDTIGGVRYWMNGEETSMEPGESSFSSYMSEEYVLMQYTGLKDKNGKEIYEGDILDCCGREKYEVIWENCGFQTKWDMGNGFFDIEPLGSVEDMSVIGNVYENPSLINK